MATPTVQLHHGSPIMVDYTPSGDVAGGDVVVVGDVPMIAHNDIANGELGALAAGGGVYRVPKTVATSSAIAAGANVWWDAGNGVATTTASTHKHLGETVAAAGDDDAFVLVKHNPRPALS